MNICVYASNQLEISEPKIVPIFPESSDKLFDIEVWDCNLCIIFEKKPVAIFPNTNIIVIEFTSKLVLALTREDGNNEIIIELLSKNKEVK